MLLSSTFGSLVSQFLYCTTATGYSHLSYTGLLLLLQDPLGHFSVEVTQSAQEPQLLMQVDGNLKESENLPAGKQRTRSNVHTILPGIVHRQLQEFSPSGLTAQDKWQEPSSNENMSLASPEQLTSYPISFASTNPPSEASEASPDHSDIEEAK